MVIVPGLCEVEDG